MEGVTRQRVTEGKKRRKKPFGGSATSARGISMDENMDQLMEFY